jgi:hypothetical protein
LKYGIFTAIYSQIRGVIYRKPGRWFTDVSLPYQHRNTANVDDRTWSFAILFSLVCSEEVRSNFLISSSHKHEFFLNLFKSILTVELVAENNINEKKKLYILFKLILTLVLVAINLNEISILIHLNKYLPFKLLAGNDLNKNMYNIFI